MKKIFRIFFLAALSVGIFNTADAQRTRNAGGSADRGNNRSASSQPHFDRGNRGSSAPVRTFSGNSGNSNRDNAANLGNNRTNARPTPERNPTTRPSPQTNQSNNRPTPQRNTVVTRTYSRPYSASRNNYRYSGNRYSNNYRYASNYYRNNYRNGYGHRTVFMYGPRYRVVPRNSISIYFGGSPYYYNQGYFYGYYGGYYQPLFPPFGLRINVLPFGYTHFYVGADPFYYYNGIYYRQYDDNNYEVVDAPMGATVSSLPKGAKLVIVNGEKLYELNGTYYKADRDSKGNDVYTVVGKNGEINNTDEDNSLVAPPESMQIGDVVNQLPEGSKLATINGEKVYLTPDETYLQEETIDGVVRYKVVGK